MQPVELTAVADRLLDCAEAELAGRLPDLGGPREEDLLDLSRQWLAHTGVRARVLGIPLPGRAGKAVQAGGLLVTDGEIRGRSFAEWLSDQPQG